MSQDVRRAILESRDEVIGSFPVHWNTRLPRQQHADHSGRLLADPEILASLFDRLFTLTAEGFGTVAIRFVDDNGSFVMSSAQLLPQQTEMALSATAR